MREVSFVNKHGQIEAKVFFVTIEKVNQRNKKEKGNLMLTYTAHFDHSAFTTVRRNVCPASVAGHSELASKA